MSFDPGSHLDSSRVSDTRGRGGGGGMLGGGGGGMLGGGGMKIGGGAGILVLLVAAIFLGPQVFSGLIDPASQGQTDVQGAGSSVQDCQTGADANERDDCRIVGTLTSLDSYWKDGATRLRTTLTAPAARIFSGGVQTACGSASSDMGPFYCPGDQTIYIDPSFYQELTSRYGADAGALAQEYVVAHEYGHHIQNLTGSLDQAQQGSGANGGSVRVELQADCYAGVWANHAASTTDSTGHTLIEPLTAADIRSALSAAAAVGDDHIQKQATGRVDQESWTHGSSAERQAWFTVGYNTGDPGRCDTFSARDLNRPGS